MSKSSFWTIAVAVLVAVPALACGPDYGSRLLEDRQRALLGLEEGSFSTEVPFLVEPPTGLPEAGGAVSREELERRVLDSGQLEQWQEMQKAYSTALAFERGKGLPEALRHYAAGARAWHREQWSIAAPYFSAAAEQRGNARNPWPLMGEYMRARGHARVALMADDLLADSQAREAAEKAMAGFEATRERVRTGEPDPLRLSVASLGEQARLLKRLGRLQEAIQLYAEQAALGSASGRQSVFFMTRWARTQPEALEAFLDFPLGRELLVLYAYTHFPSSGATRDNEVWSAYRHQNESGNERVGFRDVFEQILKRLESLPPEQLPATDRLAALLYRQGHFERAERTVALADSPLADWVRAKLALRNDQPDQAADYFHRAMRGFDGVYWDATNYRRDTRKPACLIATEASLLALSRNELTRSLKLMLEAGAIYWLDAAYLADHVLTVDELVEVAETMYWDDADRSRVFYFEGQPLYRPSRRHQLETLVGRRLMRAGRYEEAIEVFPFDAQRENARRYAALMHEPANEALSDKARRLFEAAVMTRRYGLNLLGYEAEPDFAHYDGNYHFEYGPGQAQDDARREETARWLAPREVDWIRAGKIRQLPRYTYRITAAELADQAADHLPPQSEAFAAVLCHATKWLLVRYPEAGREYYYRYRREGQTVDWHDDFGQRCPEPDFDASFAAVVE